jgi:putative endonuclease
MNTREIGQLGERLTCEYLVNNGYNILGKNHRITFGEIDIIAQKKLALLNKIFQILAPSKVGLFNRVNHFACSDRPIHFIEVKTIVSEKDFFPEEKVDSRKQRKLRKLAQIWLNTNGFKENLL